MRDFSPEFKNDILRKWNDFYTKDPTTLSQLDRKYFHNNCLKHISRISNEHSFSLLGHRNITDLSRETDRKVSWILAAGFSNSSSLVSLLSEQFQFMKNKGFSEIRYSDFSPGYFFPGVDLKAYGELYNTLLDSGFSRESEGIAMSADLEQMYYPQKERNDIRIMPLDEDHRLEFIDFIQKYYPGDCATRAMGVIENGSMEQIFIATSDKEIAGYAMYSAGEGPMEFAPGERFGCFEVLDQYQSMGIGSALLSGTLMSMKSNGIQKAYFLWTGERAKKLYERFGFKETRRFQILSAKL